MIFKHKLFNFMRGLLIRYRTLIKNLKPKVCIVLSRIFDEGVFSTYASTLFHSGTARDSS